MRRSTLGAVIPIAVGAWIGLVLPHHQALDVEFARGGRTWRFSDSPGRALPSTLNLKDNGMLKLRLMNRDTVMHAAGVFAVLPGDSIVVAPELCSITLGPDGLRTIVMR